jgi:hypothetical protein
MTALINNTEQQPVIGGQSKNWQNLDGIVGVNAFNSSNMGQGSDRAYSGASYILDTDISVVNQLEATDINSVGNADVLILTTQSLDKESDVLAKKTRQRVSGMLLRAVVLQAVIITIWLLV